MFSTVHNFLSAAVMLYLNIDWAAWFVDSGRDPSYQTIMINIRFGNERNFVISISAVIKFN